jgi:phosphoadenosine phosphosulfate reductase
MDVQLDGPPSQVMTGFAQRLQRAEDILCAVAAGHGPGEIVLASSLSAEDMVLTHLIVALSLPIGVFTLDTGRLHQETLHLIAQAKERLGVAIDVRQPDPEAVNDYVATHGRDAFYESLELRQRCCAIRKVAPLALALEGKAAWITGQRRQQGQTRGALEEIEFDTARGMKKLNPLASWSWSDVMTYVRLYEVPINPLHARGYPSIGCEPCTRAIRPGEDPRAGRWWWEQKNSKECGLHVPGAPTV